MSWQELSFDEVNVINALRNFDDQYITKLLQKSQWSPTAVGVACAKVKREIESYSSNSEAILYGVESQDLSSFSMSALKIELTAQVPTLMQIVSTSLTRDHSTVDEGYVSTLIAAKVLGSYNQKLSAVRYLNGIILHKGGAKDTCVTRLAACRDSVTPVSLRIKLDQMGKETKNIIKDWDKPRVNSSIVFDNVNPFVKPRHQSTSKTNKLYSMTHALMLLDRVPTSSLSDKPEKTLAQVTSEDILPNQCSIKEINSVFERILCNVWADGIEAMEWMRVPAPRHDNSKFTKQKTEFVSMH